MKIFVEMSYLKDEDFIYLEKTFPEIEFINDVHHAYDSCAILSMPGFLSKDNLDKFNQLEWVFVLTAGYDTLDLDYFKHRHITLVNAKDVFSIQIAEDVFAKILYLNRNYHIYESQRQIGLWKHHAVNYEIAESTVGIIGTGSIGIEVAKRMKAFGARTLGYRRTKKAVPYIDELYTTKDGLDQLYAQSDYIIVSIPLDSHTKHLIDKKAFETMKDSALVINVARGLVIDQEAMIHALKTKKIRGVGLDVTTPEPLPSDHELWKLDSVYITPHNASASPHVRKRLIKQVISAISKYFNHEMFDNIVV
ncbi:MAG: NAD(P)-dependent oxidoreductase [Acholeplasmataceae bacterium]|jgi:phosphoglycerate dehydrogenase-like enzyme|nr:NAD(P)-dependent oxidoreductase [Acholeplasmataceae bacterium]